MDPMKHNENRGRQEFIDIMLNTGLHTVISKPIIATQTMNSFIDIIFTNCVNYEIYLG